MFLPASQQPTLISRLQRLRLVAYSTGNLHRIRKSSYTTTLVSTGVSGYADDIPMVATHDDLMIDFLHSGRIVPGCPR